jgi:hypothetical protein
MHGVLVDPGVTFVCFMGSSGSILVNLFVMYILLSFVSYRISRWLGCEVVMPTNLLGHYNGFWGLGVGRSLLWPAFSLTYCRVVYMVVSK